MCGQHCKTSTQHTRVVRIAIAAKKIFFFFSWLLALTWLKKHKNIVVMKINRLTDINENRKNTFWPSQPFTQII